MYTSDLGLVVITFNYGPGCVTDNDRVTKTYLARRLFCVYCAGEHDDSAAKVGPRTWNGHGDGFLRPCMGLVRVSTGFFMGCNTGREGPPPKGSMYCGWCGLVYACLCAGDEGVPHVLLRRAVVAARGWQCVCPPHGGVTNSQEHCPMRIACTDPVPPASAGYHLVRLQRCVAVPTW